MHSFDDLLHSLQSADLLPPVQAAYGLATLTEWHYEILSGGNYGGVGDHSAVRAGVARFTGTGQHPDGGQVAWALVLKVLPTSVNAPDQQETTREADLYASGWLHQVNTHTPSLDLRVPHYYGRLERTGYGRGLWLESLPAAHSLWTPDHYALAAQHLGRFNAFMCGQLADSPACLSRHWFRGRMQRRVPLVTALQQATTHPIIQRLYSPAMLSFALRLWDAHPRWLDLLDGLPHTFCHLDTFRRNLLSRTVTDGTQDTIALDWAFAGFAPFGADLAPLVWVSAIFREIDPLHIPALDQLVFPRYVQGLAEAGWQGDPRYVRFAYLTMALMNVAIPTELMQFLDEASHPALARGFGFSVSDIIDNWASLLNVAATYWDEALALETAITRTLRLP
jgi:hypothetical protein